MNMTSKYLLKESTSLAEIVRKRGAAPMKSKRNQFINRMARAFASSDDSLEVQVLNSRTGLIEVYGNNNNAVISLDDVILDDNIKTNRRRQKS